ncbi:hypothetical protein B0H14DRAFT_2376012, partial [Mycena olivaceomarginata]
LCMVYKFSHLMMLKWGGGGGGGYAKLGIMGTKQGKLALQCPCCPIPDVNLPFGWEHALPELLIELTRFLYIWHLVSNELKDPSLGLGWAFLLQSAPYHKFLITVMDKKEMSTCSGLAAFDFANTKFAWGCSATGVYCSSIRSRG